MNLKKNLKSYKAQAVVEYIVIFAVITVATVVIFGGFNLGDRAGNNGNLRIKSVFDQSLNYAINRIGNWEQRR